MFRIFIRESNLKHEKHLIPQACFEIGQINRRLEKKDEAEEWFKRAKNYSGYSTEPLMRYRINYSISEMR